ncbi:MAG: hypothetical protein JRN15_05520 [Nitrososphaerota archaeon]|nr:hypothetical protein [Nitrososphaerota archaeon]
MLDISSRPELPGKAIVYMDGQDARLFKRLAKILGSEKRAQNAMILIGLLAGSSNEKLSTEDQREIVSSFQEIIGYDYEVFQKLVEML